MWVKSRCPHVSIAKNDKNNENDSEWCIICHIFPGLPECSKSPKIWVKIGDKTSDTTRLSDYLHPNPRHDFWGHCLSCLSRLSPMLAKSSGDVRWVFSALMTCLKVNVGNVRNTNVRERVTRTCLLQTPTMQYFSTLFMLFYERTMLRQLVKCITCHVCSIMQPFSKNISKLVRWTLCIQSLQIYHCLLAQWVDNLVLDSTERPVQRPSWISTHPAGEL